MTLNNRKRKQLTPSTFIAPAFPFSGPELFQDLRRRLASSLGEPMTYNRLARILGRSLSTAFSWCEFFSHPHVLGFVSLVERLSPAERGEFWAQRLRVTPALGQSSLSCSQAKIAQLHALLSKTAGITLIVGATDLVRSYLFSALGHRYCRLGGTQQPPAGIDLHRPVSFVPVESLLYIDHTIGVKEQRQLVATNLPRILTKRSALLLFNGVWSAAPEFRPHLLKCARQKHVILADEILPDLMALRRQLTTPIHVLTLWESKRSFGRFRVHFRVANPPKPEQKRRFRKKVHSPS